MLINDYSPTALQRLVRKEDFPKYIKYIPQEIPEIASEISKRFLNSFGSDSSFTRSNFMGSKGSLNNKFVFLADSYYETLTIRCLANNIKKNLCKRHTTREREILSILSLVRSSANPTVFRTDIKSFFESVSFIDLIKNIDQEGCLDRRTVHHLYSLESILAGKHGYKGIPRGLSISSPLADYYMRTFDQSMRMMDGSVHYSR